MKPALSEAEWAEVDFSAFVFDALLPPPEHFVYEMAVSNYALPKDSPYKITREDVAMLNDEALFAAFPHRMRHMRILAAKLAALLPPP